MAVILETERLILREFVIEDAPFMLKLVNDPSWLKYIGDRNVHSIEDAEQYVLNGALKSYATLGFGFYVVVWKHSQLLIGTCGLTKRDFLDIPDFGFAFLPEFTGKGYAFEAAEATLAYAGSALGIKELAAITLPLNTRSIRLLLKLGFAFKKSLFEDREQLDLYRITLKSSI